MADEDDNLEEFLRIRQAPVGRASMFDPEILLVRSLKQDVEKPKQAKRAADDILNDAASRFIDKIVASMQGQDASKIITEIIGYVKKIRHFEDLDADVAIAAAYLKFANVDGIDPDPRNPGKIKTIQKALEIYARDILDAAGSSTRDTSNVIVDIITYYNMMK